MYFKSVLFPSNLNQSQVETALRKVSMKETMSLDFNFKSVNIGTDKKFWGLEGKKDLKFTRLKTSFEFFLPKLIISLSKDPSVNNYRIRPGAVPIAIMGLLGFGTFISLIGILRGKVNIESFIPFILMIIIYASIFFFELKLTTSRLTKVLNNA